MPIWSNEAPAQTHGPALPIKRTPAQRPLKAVVTSRELLGCPTHFHKGHTVPCEGNGCEACHDNIPYRWHAYVSAVDCHTGLHFIFECTAQASDAFKLYFQAHSSLRGCLFNASRMSQKPNGRVIIQTKPAILTQVQIPEPPNLAHAMAIIWGLPTDSVDAEDFNPERESKQLKVEPKPNPPAHPT